MTPKDRRRSTRTLVDAIGSLERDSTVVLVDIKDVSASGLSLHCFGIEVEEGEPISVEFSVGQGTVTLTGHAVRVEREDAHSLQIGMRFSPLDDKAFRLLFRAIEDGERSARTD